MASIKFKNIRFKNFLSVGNAWMEYDLDQLGASGIVGSNGAGKSLLLDGLCFGLYGKSYRKCNKPNLINSTNERESVVEIEFDTTGRSYRIVRGQKPNIFEIYQDGVLLNQDAKAKDYQLFLENDKRVSVASADRAGVPNKSPQWDTASTRTNDLPNRGSLKNR